MTDPTWPSLTSGPLDAVWARVRDRLERQGLSNRGRLRLPDLDPVARRNLGAVLGTTPRSMIDLAALEEGLRGLGVGDDLPASLGALGFAVSDEPARRRAERRAGRDARDAARAEAGIWPEPWAGEWIGEVVRAGAVRGLDADQAVALVRSVRAVLDALAPDEPGGEVAALGEAAAADPQLRTGAVDRPRSRVDLAAAVLGSAHALDTGTRVEAAVTRALAHVVGRADARTLWEQAGVHLDLTSGPVLTWNLPVAPGGGLTGLVAAATAAGVPLHLTQYALRAHPVGTVAGADILVVENPRLVEAAAQLAIATPVVATNGNPSGAVRLLLGQLLGSGANLRYHGDFDAAGLAIAARLHAVGLMAWRMTADDYLQALAQADAAGVELPTDESPVGPTPWDPPLATAFASHRLIVHEERLLPELLLDR